MVFVRGSGAGVLSSPPSFYTPRPTHSLVDMGSRFAELESIVAITMLLQHYKITVKEDPEFAGERFEQKKERVLDAKLVLTLTSVAFLLCFCVDCGLLIPVAFTRPVRVPLVFTRRN